MPSRSPADAIPPEVFLHGYPPPILAVGQRLRWIVKRAVPDAIERVRPGWALIGYDLPVKRRAIFFAWVWPEAEHVHLGFPVGTLMDDHDGVLQGAGITKKARWLTYRPGDDIDERLAGELVEEAARVAVIPRSILG
jgi:hypothetical protein